MHRTHDLLNLAKNHLVYFGLALAEQRDQSEALYSIIAANLCLVFLIGNSDLVLIVNCKGAQL